MLFRRRPSEVAAWPAWEVRLLEQYLAKQPSAEDRIEIAIARLTATFINSKLGPGSKPAATTDFLGYRDPWAGQEPEVSEYQTANQGWLRTFRNLSTRMRK